MLDAWFSSLGETVEYHGHDDIIEPGDDTKGRDPKVETTWVSFKALVDPAGADNIEPGGREEHFDIVFFTLLELDRSKPVRHNGREYIIVSVTTARMFNENIIRYGARAVIQGS